MRSRASSRRRSHPAPVIRVSVGRGRLGLISGTRGIGQARQIQAGADPSAPENAGGRHIPWGVTLARVRALAPLAGGHRERRQPKASFAAGNPRE